MINNQLQGLATALGAYGEVDMLFACEMDAKERTAVEDLVLEWYNQAVKRPAVKLLEFWTMPKRD